MASTGSGDGSAAVWARRANRSSRSIRDPPVRLARASGAAAAGQSASGARMPSVLSATLRAKLIKFSRTHGVRHGWDYTERAHGAGAFHSTNARHSCCQPTMLIVAGSSARARATARLDPDRHRRQHPRHVRVPDTQHVAAGIVGPRQDVRGSRGHRGERLAARHLAAPHRPGRPPVATRPDLGSREALELAVVPLREVVVDDRVRKARERRRLTCAYAWARQHTRERHFAKRGTKRTRASALPVSVSDTSVRLVCMPRRDHSVSPWRTSQSCAGTHHCDARR